MQTVSLDFFFSLLLFDPEKEIAFLFVGALECFLFDRGPKECGPAIIVNLHHLLLLLLDFLLLVLVLSLL